MAESEALPLRTLAKWASEQPGVKAFLPFATMDVFAGCFLDRASPNELFEGALRDGATLISSGPWRSRGGGLRERTIELQRSISGSPRRVVNAISEWRLSTDTALVRIRVTTPDWAQANKVTSFELMLITPAVAEKRPSSVPATIPSFPAHSGELLVLCVYEIEIDRSGIGFFVPAAYARSSAITNMTADRERWCSLARPALERALGVAPLSEPASSLPPEALEAGGTAAQQFGSVVVAAGRPSVPSSSRGTVARGRERGGGDSATDVRRGRRMQRDSLATTTAALPREGIASDDGLASAAAKRGEGLVVQHTPPLTAHATGSATGPVRRIRWYTQAPAAALTQATLASGPTAPREESRAGRALQQVGQTIGGAFRSGLARLSSRRGESAGGGDFPARGSASAAALAGSATSFTAAPDPSGRAGRRAGAVAPPVPGRASPPVARTRLTGALARSESAGSLNPAGGASTLNAPSDAASPSALGIGPPSAGTLPRRRLTRPPPPPPPAPLPPPQPQVAGGTAFSDSMSVVNLVRSLWG